MDNMHQPPGGDPQDWPTQELGPPAGRAGPAGRAEKAGQAAQARQRSGQPSGQAGASGQPWGQPTGQPWHQPTGVGGGPSSPRPQRRRWLRGGVLHVRPLRGGALWWGAGLALVALLAGGVLAATSSTSQSAAGPTGQAAVLNTLLNSASPGAAGAPGNAVTASAESAAPCRNGAAKLKAAGHPFAARIALWRCHHRLHLVRALGGIHGQFTFETKTGARTLAYERGVIQSVSGIDVVVQAKDGTTWTWVLGASTVIRESGERAATTALSDGENVFAGGPVVSGTYNARLIVIRASSDSPSSGPTPSPASGS
jgi:hypothetical protein